MMISSMPRRIVLSLTPSQLRCVNAGLALLEADPEMTTMHDVTRRTMDNTRATVWDALDAAGIRP